MERKQSGTKEGEYEEDAFEIPNWFPVFKRKPHFSEEHVFFPIFKNSV